MFVRLLHTYKRARARSLSLSHTFSLFHTLSLSHTILSLSKRSLHVHAVL